MPDVMKIPLSLPEILLSIDRREGTLALTFDQQNLTNSSLSPGGQICRKSL